MKHNNYASGKITNRDLCQITDFSNLRFELKKTTISPTDIDGSLEYRGIFNITLELKYGDNDIVPAQDYAFRNQTNSLNRGGYNGGAYIIVANHEHKTTDDIDAGGAIVRKLYVYDMLENKGRWKWLKEKQLSVNQVVDKLMKYHNIA